MVQMRVTDSAGWHAPHPYSSPPGARGKTGECRCNPSAQAITSFLSIGTSAGAHPLATIDA